MIISEVQNKIREAATASHRAMTESVRLGLFAVRCWPSYKMSCRHKYLLKSSQFENLILCLSYNIY